MNEFGITRPHRLGEEVYSAIYGQLMSLRIPPGGRISIDSLSRELGVSQTPTREALSRLEEQGLVTKAHLIGYSAADQLEHGRFEQLCEVRVLLEPVAAAKAALNMDEEARKRLAGLADDMQAEPGATRLAYGRFAQRDREFHDMIAAGSGNALIRESLARLHVHVHLFRLFHHSHAVTAAVEEHNAIVAAILDRDAAAASDAMLAHLEASRLRFSSAFVEG